MKNAKFKSKCTDVVVCSVCFEYLIGKSCLTLEDEDAPGQGIINLCNKCVKEVTPTQWIEWGYNPKSNLSRRKK